MRRAVALGGAFAVGWLLSCYNPLDPYDPTYPPGLACPDGLCPPGQYCDVQLKCQPLGPGQCAAIQVCGMTGSFNSDCADPNSCDPETHGCVPRCPNGGNCGAGQMCDCNGNVCRPTCTPPGNTCPSGLTCGNDQLCHHPGAAAHCQAGFAPDPLATTECLEACPNARPCSSGACDCNGHVCRKPCSPGQACMEGAVAGTCGLICGGPGGTSVCLPNQPGDGGAHD